MSEVAGSEKRKFFGDAWTATSNRLSWLLIIGISLAALYIRLYYVTHTVVVQQANAPGAHGDAVQYYRYAFNLVHRGIFSLGDTRSAQIASDSFRDPGYPLFLAAWMKAFPTWDKWYASVLISQAFIGALTVTLWLAVGRRWMSITSLGIAGFLMAVWPHSVTSTSNLLIETLYGFFVALSVFLLCFAREAHSAWASVTGVSFALTALTNAVSLPVSVLIAAYGVICRNLSLSRGLLLLVTTLTIATPWLIRNTLIAASDFSSANRAIMNLVEGSWPTYQTADMASSLAHDPNAQITMDKINREITILAANHRAGFALLKERIAADPCQYIRWYLSKPALLWGWDVGIGMGDVYFHATYHSPYRTQFAWRFVASLCQALNPALFILAAIGCFIGLAKKGIASSWKDTSLLLLVITVVHSLLQADPRYSTPYRGAELCIAIATAQKIIQYALLLRSRSTGDM